MRRIQWFVFGIGMLILSYFLFLFSWGTCYGGDNYFVGCMVRRYSYAIPAIITQFLSWMFIICGFLEPKIKKK